MTNTIFIEGLWEKRIDGYYFRGEFIDRYKPQSIEILRKKFKSYSDEEKKRFKDEWTVINYEYEKTQKGRRFSVRAIKEEQLESKEKQIEQMERYTAEKHLELCKLVESNKLNHSILNERLNEIEEKIKVILKHFEKEKTPLMKEEGEVDLVRSEGKWTVTPVNSDNELDKEGLYNWAKILQKNLNKEKKK